MESRRQLPMQTCIGQSEAKLQANREFAVLLALSNSAQRHANVNNTYEQARAEGAAY